MNADAIEIPITTDATKFAQQTAKAARGLYDLEKAQIAVNAALGVARTAWDTLVKTQIDATRQIDRLSKTSQLTTRTVAGLRLAAQNAGKEVEDIVPKGLGDRLADLRDGTQSVVDDFALIGLKASDFAAVNYDLDASLGLILNGLRDAPSAMNRAAAATRLLEGEGEILVGTLTGGADELERFASAAEKVGAGTPAATAAARELAAATTALNLAMEEAGATLTEFAGATGAGGLAKDFAVGFAFALDAAASSLRSMAAQAKEINGVEVFRALVLGEGLSAFVNAADGVQAFGDALGAGRKNAAAMGQALTVVGSALDTIGGEGESAPVRKVTKAIEGQTKAVEDVTLAWESYPSAIGANLAIAFGVQAAHNQLVQQANDEARAEEVQAERAALRMWSEARAKATERAIEDAERLKEAQRDGAQASVGYAADGIAAIVSLAEGATGEMRALLIAAAVAERAAAVARAIFQVGPAFAQGVAAAPPPLGPILGGINAAAVVAAAAATAAAPLPKYHTGRDTAPDEEVAVLQRKERVLTPAAIQAMNAGRGGSGDSGSAIVVLGHEAVSRATVRAMQDPTGHLAKAITRGDLPGRTRRRQP
jgi:hypothetical protein